MGGNMGHVWGVDEFPGGGWAVWGACWPGERGGPGMCPLGHIQAPGSRLLGPNSCRRRSEDLIANVPLPQGVSSGSNMRRPASLPVPEPIRIAPSVWKARLKLKEPCVLLL